MSKDAAAAVETNTTPDPKKPVARKELTRAQWTRHEIKRNWLAYALLAPFYILFTIFTILPVVASLVISFTDFNMLEMPHFVFMDNYINLLLSDDLFLTACKNTFIFGMVTGPVCYALSFFMAWFINELPPKLRAIVTLIFYAPSISGNATLVFNLFFSGDSYGYINGFLINLGVIDSPIQFLTDAFWIKPMCIIAAIWTSLGTAFLSFIAGLQGVPRDLYEAGAMDGIKNRWQELWYVTLPYMRPQLMFGAVLSITGAISFTGITGALATDYESYTLVDHLNEYGSTRYEIGYSSAIATIMFALSVGLNLLIRRMLSKVGQ